MPPPNKNPRQKSDSTPSTPSKSSKTKKADKAKLNSKAFNFKPIRCKKCNNECLEEDFMDESEDESIACDLCGHWYHKPCTDVLSDEWAALKGGNESITYKCDSCLNKSALKIKESNNQAEMFQNVLLQNNDIIFKRLESLEANIMTKVDEKIDQRMKEFEQKKQQTIENKITERLNSEKQQNQEQTVIKDQIKVQVSQSFDELKDRQERKTNLILFNIKESTKTEIAEAVKDDVKEIIKIFQHTNPELKEKIGVLDEEKVVRLGKKKERDENNADNTRPRPMKVTLPEEYLKFKILKNSHKFKTFAEHPKVGIKPDLTKQQQYEERALREELERRKKLKEDVMIFRGKVILRSDLQRLRSEASRESKDAAATSPTNKQA